MQDTKAKHIVKPNIPLPSLCAQLQELNRQRNVNLKSRIMIENRLVATVATASGYHAGMEEKERLKRFDAARKTIAIVREDHDADYGGLAPLIIATSQAIKGFDLMVDGYEKEMEKLAKQLPVAAWVAKQEQRGFGLLSLAKIVGECGDLNNYPNPGKLWRRMGCAPYEAHGKVLMPSTWRTQKPGLSAEEWEDCGYNPRRRSVAYLIGEGIVKQNGEGPYRKRYDEVKERSASTHDDWKPLRCHRHAMLLATKRLLLELWIEWTGNDHGFVWRSQD